MVFNVNGELTEFHDANTPANNRFFANNQSGQALTAVQGDVGSKVPGAFDLLIASTSTPAAPSAQAA